MVDDLRPMDMGIGPLRPGPLQPRPEETSSKTSFEHLLKEFVGDVNVLQQNAGQAVDRLAAGEVHDVHQVMVAVEEASVALDLLLEIRNRVMEGYQEIMRMQV